MTDTYQITFDDGEIAFFNRAACFAPMMRFKQGLAFISHQKMEDTKKPIYLTYFVTDKGVESTNFSSYICAIRAIPQFKHLIKNCVIHNNFASITIDLRNKVDAVLYCLGAFRYIKERANDRVIIDKLIRCQVYKHPALFYLLCEGLYINPKGEIDIINYSRGHSNGQPRLLYSSAKDFCFMKDPSTFGSQKLFSEHQAYANGWGQLGGKEGSFGDVKKFATNKDGENYLYGRFLKYIKGKREYELSKAVKQFADKFMATSKVDDGTGSVANIKAVVKKEVRKRQAAVKKAVKKPVGIKDIGGINGLWPVLDPLAYDRIPPAVPPKVGNKANWLKLLKAKEHSLDRRNIYQRGYRKGYRLNERV